METILDRIHRSSLELLASIGVRFHCPEIIERIDSYMIKQDVPESVLAAVGRASHAA